MRNDYIRRITALTMAVAMALIGIGVNARDVDVVVAHRDAKGVTERAVTNTSNVDEIRNRIVKGTDLSILKKLAPGKFKDSAAPDLEGQDGFKVLFAVEEENNDEYSWDPWKVYVTHPDGEYSRDYYNYAYKPDAEMEAEGYQWGCNVPEGTYDVILGTSRSTKGGSFIYAYIVKENVAISGDTTITFRQSDAKNLLTSKFYFEDGQEMLPLNEDNYMIYGYQYSRCLNHKGGSYGLNADSYGGVRDSILVNDLNDNWTYAINQAAVTPKGAYVNKLVVPGPFTSDMNFANNPEDYVETCAKFNPLDSTNMKLNAYGVNSFMTWKGADWSCSTGLIMKYDGDYTGSVKMFLNVGRSDMSPETGYDVFVSPVIGQNAFTYYEDWGDGDIHEYTELAYSSGADMLPDNGSEYLYVNGGYDWGYQLEQYPDEKFFLPVLSPFAYKGGEMTYFEYAPILWLDYMSSEYNDWVGMTILNGYCETTYPTFESWSLPTVESVTNNGQTYVLKADERLWDWSAAGNYVPGPVNIDYSAVWKTEFDKALTTKTSFNFDTSKELYNPPMVMQYQVRNGSDVNAYTVDAGGKIIFGVKDIDNDVNEVLIKMAVSGSDVWEDLPCENIESYDDYSTYGKYYEAALSELEGAVSTAYDLRFECKDTRGNSSVAVIESALKLDSSVSVGKVESERCPVRVVGNRIIAPEEAAIFNLNGVRVNNDNLTSGVYFVRLGRNTYKIFIK